MYSSDVEGKASWSYADEYKFMDGKQCTEVAEYFVPVLGEYSLLTIQQKMNIITQGAVPRVGLVAIENSPLYPENGHVAYIETVNGTQITTIDGNWVNSRVCRRVGTVDELGIIGYFDPSTITIKSQVQITTATPTQANLLLDGNKKVVPAYNIGGNNYFKLRDIAEFFKNTVKKFNVLWDNIKVVRVAILLKFFIPTDYTNDIYKEACKLFDEAWKGEPIRHLGVRVSELCGNDFVQLSLLENSYEKQRQVDKAVDGIRMKYGSFTEELKEVV